MSKLGVFTGGLNNLMQVVKAGTKKRSPEILMTLGTIGVVTTTVVACVQTRKLDDVLTEHEETLARIKKLREESAELGEPNEYGKETAMLYGNTTFKIARLYALPLTMGVASLFCFFGAHRILKKRTLALAAAYNALDMGFKQYRGRVAERFGEEVENQIRHGITPKEIEVREVDDNGEETTVKKTVNVADGETGFYQRYFTRHNGHWDKSPDRMHFFFKAEQEALNNLLKSRARSNPKGIGIVTFNEVLERLGFDIPDDGSGLVTGWIFDERNPVGDNYIEFDITRCHLPGEKGTLEEAYSIDFNVDGNIYKELHQRDLARRGHVA